MAGTPAIELVDVHTAFDDERVLCGVSFIVPSDAITVLVGPSGGGKTTCVRHITGLLVPDAGEVLVEGRSRFAMRKAEHAALSRRFGVQIQGSGQHGSALWGSMTVVENLMFQLRALSDLSEDELRERALARLQEVGLADHAEIMPMHLSAGMTTRVALARALVSDPDFAVLDSVDHGIDPVRLGRLCDLILWHRDTLGGSYLVTTHDMEVARRIADHVVVLWGGEVVEQGPADAVFASTRPEVRQLLTGEETGPLALRSEQRPAGQAPAPPHQPGEHGFDVPVEVAMAVTLLIISGAVLFIGDRNAIEIGVVLLVWTATAVAVAVRRQAR